MATVHATVLTWQSGDSTPNLLESFLGGPLLLPVSSTGKQTVPLQDTLQQVRTTFAKQEMVFKRCSKGEP